MRRPALLLLLLAACPACRSFDDARILQALNQRGFGRKYVGDANEVLTVGIGDTFQISDPNNADIHGNYQVGLDGVVQDKLLGEVFVAGFTRDEIAEALNQRFGEYYTSPDVRVALDQPLVSKRFFMRGETTVEGERPLLRDTTVWDAVMQVGVPITADLGDIYVIRSDPRHPLIIPVDLAKMLDHGDSSDNILIREDDIVVVNPNFAGLVRRGVQLLLAPLLPVQQLAISVRNIDTVYKSFQDDENFFVGSRGYGYGIGSNAGGGYGGGGIGVLSTGNGVVVPPGGSEKSGP